MKRTYCRLSSELLRFDTEAGFMQCSVRMASDVTVEEYHDFKEWADETSVTESGFKIGFDE